MTYHSITLTGLLRGALLMCPDMRKAGLEFGDLQSDNKT